MRISIRVYLTDKCAAARVVYIDPENPLHCGIELDEPRNILGVRLPPDDWAKTGGLELRHLWKGALTILAESATLEGEHQ